MTKPAMRPRPDEATLKRQAIRLALTYGLYGAAIVASAVTTFGAIGLLPGLLIAAAWCYIFLSRSRPTALRHVIIMILAGLFIAALVTPAVQQAREATRRFACRNNLKQISLALHNYHDAHGSFPPAYLADASGRRMHSWRVLILPYLDGQALYSAYNFDEPWDSPDNLKLLSQMPEVYTCPTSLSHEHRDQGFTTYVAVVGDGTAWPGPNARRIGEMRDGTSTIVHVVEHESGARTLWTEPRDLDIDEAVSILGADNSPVTSGHRVLDFFYEQYPGRYLAFADGSVRFASRGIDREVWSTLLNVNDGIPANDWDVPSRHVPVESRLRIGNCSRLALFVLLALLPLPWVWINPTSEGDGESGRRETGRRGGGERHGGRSCGAKPPSDAAAAVVDGRKSPGAESGTVATDCG